MEYVKEWDTALIQFQRMEVENVEEIVQTQNHATEYYVQVIQILYVKV